MSASEMVLHQMFQNVVAEYHPLADYLGYQEFDDGFLLFYKGVGEVQSMAVDTQGNIIADSTIGTTRSMGLLAVGAALLGAFMGSPNGN